MGWIHATPIPAAAVGADQTFRPLDKKKWAHLHRRGPGYASMLTIKPQPDVTARPAKKRNAK